MPVYAVTLNELVALVHETFPTLENADVRENSMEFSIGEYRYWVDRYLNVYQVIDDYINVTDVATGRQAELRRAR